VDAPCYAGCIGHTGGEHAPSHDQPAESPKSLANWSGLADYRAGGREF